MYAIVETGGKQYKVVQGKTIKVDRIEAAEGATVELNRVLMIGHDKELTVGNPIIEGASVMATVKAEGKAKKIIVFKYKSKTRYDRKQGHRQLYTELNIDSINAPGKAAKKAAEKPATFSE